jgi:hypothetical protein
MRAGLNHNTVESFDRHTSGDGNEISGFIIVENILIPKHAYQLSHSDSK